MGRTQTYTKQMSVMFFPSFWFEIGDFVFQDESQKTLSILCLPNRFHGKAPQRYVFLPEHDALFKEFFYLYVQFTSKNTIYLLPNRGKNSI